MNKKRNSMKTQLYPKLTLVGAGPGDPGLITLKGVEALQAADIVLYDALVNTELLKFVPVGVKKIFVGKRRSSHTYSQDQINALIVDFAYSYGHVVRLKGGDPFVFGRGQEEIQYVRKFNIETEYVPGISSSIALAGLQGIPVTHRGTSESFWVITGTTSKGELSADIELAAQSTATVIILMGLNKLSEIAELFRKYEKQDTGVAIIQNGSLPSENMTIGTIDTIVELAREEGIGSPAVIIIGETVKSHVDFPQSLANWKYLLN
jgi:uroporphyrin-III C-methyltransferase